MKLMQDQILKSIGEAAALEQLAEECTELAQAALKLARKKRGENPTPLTEDECIEHLNEELADVETCLSVLMDTGILDFDEVIDISKNKKERWQERIVYDIDGTKYIQDEDKQGWTAEDCLL